MPLPKEYHSQGKVLKDETSTLNSTPINNDPLDDINHA